MKKKPVIDGNANLNFNQKKKAILFPLLYERISYSK